MTKFDFVLSRPREHYIEKMKSLDAEYEKSERFIGKKYLKGIHFKPQGDKIFGYYCYYNAYKYGATMADFTASFTLDSSGTLHFRGFAYPNTLACALLVLILLLSVFVIKSFEMTVIATVGLIVVLISFFIQSRHLYKELEEFFV